MTPLVSAYWDALAGWRRRAVMSVGLSTASGLMEAAALTAMVPLISQGSGVSNTSSVASRFFPGATRSIWIPLALFAALGALAACANFLSELIGLRVRARVEQRLRQELTSSLLTMQWPAFIGMRMGDISAGIMMAGGQTSLGVLGLIRGSGAMAVIVVFLLTAVLLDWRTTVIAIALGALLALAYRTAGRRAQAQAMLLNEKANSIGNQIADVMGSLKFFRSTGGRAPSDEAARRLFSDFSNTDFRSTLYRGMTRFAFEGGGVAFVATVLAVSIATEGHLTAEVLVFLALFYRLLPRMLLVQDQFLIARTQLPWFTGWRERMALATGAKDVREGSGAPTFERGVSLRRVSFTFPGTEAQVLSEIDLDIAPGECVALVGESGSGKTTLVDLVTGLLVPTTGSITVDGVRLADVDVEKWQSHVGLVMQESPLFHDTVLANVAWYASALDEDKAWHCLELAHAREFVERLPDGGRTVIGERGGRLSGGQRQRLAVARALYRDPWLLVLDEATSALDSASEAAVQAALTGLKGRCAILMVAHRLKTVEMADRIVVLERGRIVEQGSFDRLVASGHQFAAMAARQGLGVR
jgi:ABC-type multidrug transport system fused ATPase/permease subunit